MRDDCQSRMYRFMCAMLIITYIFTGWMTVVTTDRDTGRDVDYNLEDIELITVDTHLDEAAVLPLVNFTPIPEENKNIEESEEEIETDILKEPVEEEKGEEEEVVVPEVEYFEVPLSEDLQSYIFTLCESNSVDPTIIVALIFRESSYRPGIIGDGGNSFGLMQLQPKWFQERMAELGITDLLDPYQNVTLGIDYVAELMGTGKSIEWVLMAYNGGPSYANDKASQGIVTEYAETVINFSNELKGGCR